MKKRPAIKKSPEKPIPAPTGTPAQHNGKKTGKGNVPLIVGIGAPRDNDGETKTGSSLRQRAEKRLGEQPEDLHIPVKKEEMHRLLHELQVHQIELEIQNEELVRTQCDVEAGLERYSELYEFAPVGYLTLDKNGTIRQVNLTGTTLLGTERSLLVARRFQDFIAAGSRSVFNEFLRTVFEMPENKIRSVELTLECDPPIVVQAEAHVIGSGRECFMTVTDITSRKRAEDALWESENRYRILTESSPDQIFVIGRDDTIQYVNTTSLKLFHLPYDEVIGKPRKNLFPAEIAGAQGILLKTVFETGEIVQKEEKTRFGTQELWIHTTLVPLKDMAENVTAVLGNARDITGRKNLELTLHESEERYRSLFENANEGILFADIETTKFVHANPAICRMLGYEKEELLSMSVADIHPKDRLDYVLLEFRKLVTGEQGVVTDIPCLRKDGTVRMMDVASSRVMMQGRMCLAGLFTDITERKNAEKALKESEKNYRILAEAVPDPIYIIGRDDRVRYINTSAAQLMGRTAGQIVGKARTSLFPPHIAEQQGITLWQVFDTGEPLRKETRITYGDRDLWQDHSFVPLKDENGTVLAVLGISHDITLRKQVEESLRESRAQYQQLVENINDVIFTLDLNGTVTYISPVVERQFGFTVPEVTGQHLSRFVHPDDLPSVAQEFRRRMEGEYGSNEFRIRTKDGSERYVRTAQTPIMADGRIAGFNYVMTDITERKAAEDALRESENYLQRVLDSIDAGFMVIDPATHSILDVNPAAVKLIGAAREEIIGSECHRFICPAKGGTCPVTDLHQSAAHSEHILLKASGAQCPIIKTVIPITLKGKPVLLETFIDITIQKQAEWMLKDFNGKLQQGIEEKTATLRESELRHSRLFESSQDAIMTLEPPDWYFTSGNPATVAMFRARDETEFTSKGPWELSPQFQPDGLPSGEKAKEMIGTAMRDGSNYFGWTHKRLDGEDFPATVLLTRFEWKGKQILQATVRDITRQVQNEAALRESESRYRALIETTGTGYVIIDNERKVRDANPEYVRLTGHHRLDEIAGRSVLEWTAEHEKEKNAAAISQCVRDGFIRNLEIDYTDSDGNITPIEINATVVPTDGTFHILAMCRDITGRKQADDKIRASLDEKVLLLREIHHRVKNNLQIIISLVNLQMRQIEDERLKQVMAETQNRVRAMSLVHEKLYQSEDISRIDLASYTRFLVTQLFSFYGVDSRQVALDVDIGTIMLDVNTAIPLGLIINELASNTLKHAFPNGRTGTLSIAVREDGRTLSLTIKNDGEGLPADFDWRHTESLGLRLVISLVEQLDGTIDLDRTAGTAFTIVVKEKE